MSLTAQAARLAAKASRQRGTLYAGETTPLGKNIQIGNRKLTLAFTRFAQVMEIRSHGRVWRCTAAIRVPLCLDLAVDEGTIVTHLPTGDLYDVVEILHQPAVGEQRLTLHRQED